MSQVGQKEILTQKHLSCEQKGTAWNETGRGNSTTGLSTRN